MIAYGGDDARKDLLIGIVDHLVYKEVSVERIQELVEEADGILEGMTGSEVLQVVSLRLRDQQGDDLLELISRVKDAR